MCKSTAIALTLAAASGLPAYAQQPSQPPFSGVISIRLDNAVSKQALDRPLTDALVDLKLDVACQDGKFARPWGFAEDLNRADHRGFVDDAQVTPDAIKLKVQMCIAGDPWIFGGRALYDIDLKRLPDGKLEGTQKGQFLGKLKNFATTGKVTGEILPLVQPDSGYVPLQPGEHPRLLFRKADIAKLKEKAATPIGKAFFDRIKASADADARDEGALQSAAICCGVMYQLTGEARYATKARAIIGSVSPASGLLKTGYHNGANGLPEPWGWNISTIALTYDLCYDAWDEGYRTSISNRLAAMGERLMQRPNTVCTKMNWSPGSNYQPGTRGGASVAMFAIWGEKGQVPPEPRDPGLTPPAIGPGTYTPPQGMPINDLELGKIPPKWLFTGAVPVAVPESAFDAVGGLAAPKITTATTLDVVGATLDFANLDATNGIGVQELYLSKKAPVGKHEQSYYFCALKVDKPATVRVAIGRPGARLWIAGQEVSEDAIITLQPGTLALVVTLHDANPWGTISPRFIAMTPETAQQELAKRHDDWLLAHREWQDDFDAWKASGGVDPRKTYLVSLAERHMARYFHAMMGDGGYQGEGEGYTVWSTPLALTSACVYHTAFGKLPTPRPDVSLFAPRYVAQTIFAKGKGPTAQSFGASEGTINGTHYARLFPLVPDAMKPGVLWAWNQYLGMKLDADEPSEFAGAQPPGGLDAAFGLANYPTNVQPRNPGEDGIPKVFVSKGRGNYIFRNRWQDADDIVAQIHLRSQPPVGWNHPNAGSLRIYGLGHKWAVADLEPKSGGRMFENVVVLPEDPINEGYGAFATYFDAKPDGSGTVTADLNGVYSGIKKVEAPVKDKYGKPTGEKQERSLPDSYDNQWTKDNLVDLGIHGTRSFAADYSGASGAPALFVLADRIQGGHTKVWTWQIPGATGKGGQPADVKVEGNTFIINQGDASLVGTFVSPADVKLEKFLGKQKMRVVLSSVHMTFGEKEIPVAAIQATGGPNRDAGEFLVVMTLQRGKAPEVKFDKKSLDAAITVGGQSIRYDGQKITLAK